ncbi:MAG: hypothetical protein ACXVVU_26870 [Solirubrobacteraceae bacterium]
MHEDADPTANAAPALPRVPMDAYPRLCGLPVTIERLVPTTSVPAPAERAAPARPAHAKRPVARTVVVVLVAAATLLALASEARAQAPVPSVHAGPS